MGCGISQIADQAFQTASNIEDLEFQLGPYVSSDGLIAVPLHAVRGVFSDQYPRWLGDRVPPEEYAKIIESLNQYLSSAYAVYVTAMRASSTRVAVGYSGYFEILQQRATIKRDLERAIRAAEEYLFTLNRSFQARGVVWKIRRGDPRGVSMDTFSGASGPQGTGNGGANLWLHISTTGNAYEALHLEQAPNPSSVQVNASENIPMAQTV